MCACDSVETVGDELRAIEGIGVLDKSLEAFFAQKDILQAKSLLEGFLEKSHANHYFPYDRLSPEVINQIQLFFLRTCPLSEMQQRNIGLDLFRFWPNERRGRTKFTLANFKIWLEHVCTLFNSFYDGNAGRGAEMPPFIVNKVHKLLGKVSRIADAHNELSELYVFNMAAAVFDVVSEMALWAQTATSEMQASLDPIKLVFISLERDFDKVINHGSEADASRFQKYSVQFMDLYNVNY
jgi:hypothetical protein